MRYLQGIITWINSLESGRQFRNWAAILVKILAVAILVSLSVAAIVACTDTITASIDLEITPQAFIIIGSILEVCIVITIAIVLTMLFWNRSNKIRTLDKDPNFILTSIAVIMVQLFGEAGFLSLIGIGIQTLAASIFGSGLPKTLEIVLHEQALTEIFPIDPSGNTPFISSAILSMISVLSGPIVLIVAYFTAEGINVLANIAESLNNIETKLLAEETTLDS